MSRGFAILLALGLSACGSDGAGGPDAGPVDAGEVSATLEVGTGILGFEEIGSEPLQIVQGPQGGGRFDGHHIWLALRLGKATPDQLETYGLTLFDAEGNVASEQTLDAARAPFEPDQEGRHVLSGLAPRLMDCCAIQGRAFMIEGRVTFLTGQVLTAQATGLAGMCSVACE